MRPSRRSGARPRSVQVSRAGWRALRHDVLDDQRGDPRDEPNELWHRRDVRRAGDGEGVGTVKVSVFYNDPKSLASGKPIGSRIFELGPNQLVTPSGLIESIIGPSRQSLYGDLSGVQVQFDVTSHTGSIVVYTSSVDNGTGDSILRTE